MKRIIILVVVMCFALAPVLSYAGGKSIRIETNPAGATVYIDGKDVGVAPVTAQVDGRWWYEGNSTHVFKAEKAGYAPAMQTVKASELNAAGIIGGFLCLFPFLWAAETPDVVVMNLYPLSPSGR